MKRKYTDPSTIMIKCNVHTAEELVPLLRALKTMGSVGASRSIKIEDWDGDNSFGFDGDGPSTIYEIKQDGELVKSKSRNINKKSQREGIRMNESKIALVIIPGSEGLEKAAKLSKVGSGHPAGTSAVHGKTKSKIPYTGHVERMKLAKMAAARMLAPKPEDENEHTNNPKVNQGGRVKGGKPPYNKYGTQVSGMGSQAHDNFGRATIIVKPSEIGTSTPEKSTAHTPIKEVRKPTK